MVMCLTEGFTPCIEEWSTFEGTATSLKEEETQSLDGHKTEYGRDIMRHKWRTFDQYCTVPDRRSNSDANEFPMQWWNCPWWQNYNHDILERRDGRNLRDNRDAHSKRRRRLGSETWIERSKIKPSHGIHHPRILFHIHHRWSAQCGIACQGQLHISAMKILHITNPWPLSVYGIYSRTWICPYISRR